MPFTIHAAWLPAESKVPNGQLFLWAENHTPNPTDENGHDPVGRTVSPTADTPVPNGRTDSPTYPGQNGRSRAAKVPSHPGQLAVGEFRQMVRQLATAEETDSTPSNALVWLPTQHGNPLTRIGSFQKGVSSLTNGDAGPMFLSPWQVTGLTLEPFHALTFLSRLSNQSLIEATEPSSPLRHARLGNDLRFWSHAAKTVLEILAGQHLLPGLLADSSGRFQALWQPQLLDAILRRRVEALIEAMPPICRAYNLESLDLAYSPSQLTEHFIAALVDQAVRHWAAPAQGAGQAAPSPARQWLSALLSSQATVELPPQPAHTLFQEWVGWLEQLHVTTADAQFRVAFALEAPEADNPTRWILRYFLQARADSELTVSAQQVWQEKSHSLRLGEMRFDQPQERLLAGLGIASRLFPPIKESLRTSRPERALLTTAEAHQFLREIGPLLESSGFGLILPDWWQQRGRSRLGMRLRLFSQKPGGEESLNGRLNGHLNGGGNGHVPPKSSALTLNSLIRYRWELTLGEETLDPDEFEGLIAMQSPLVNIRGRWLELDPEQMTAARTFLQGNQAEGQTNLLQALRMAQSYEDTDSPTPNPSPAAGEGGDFSFGKSLPDNLPLDTVEIEGWLDEVLQRLRNAGSMEELAEPEGFIGTLRPYQRRGAGWLWYLRRLGLGACLADDMGLGKTIEAIGLLLHARVVAAAQGETLTPTLLICPTSVVANWRHEIERFAPTMAALVHHGSGRLDGEAFAAALSEHELVITSYGTARRDIDLLCQTEWSTLILDEAQNIKNPAAKQTQAVRRIPAASRIALTGTPVENRLLELWSLMEFLNPGYLGSRESFRQQYVLPIERYNDEAAAGELRRLVQPFLLRRLKTDPTIISDLPEKNEMIVYCPLSKEQAKLYNDVVAETMARVEASQGIQRRGLVLSLLLKLKQVCNHPAHYLGQKTPLIGRSGKLSRLTAMVEEALSVDDRALIFTQFVEMGHLLKAHLEETFGGEVLFLHGGTPAAKRDQMVQAFQAEKGGPSIFILSLRAGGVGLNLTRANHVFHFDRWWNPAVENQATDRAFRIGQKRAVQVYKFVVAGTLEERIHELIESKQNLAESIVGSGEDWLSDLDTDQLRDLLSLRRDEIEEEALV